MKDHEENFEIASLYNPLFPLLFWSIYFNNKTEQNQSLVKKMENNVGVVIK